jgi:hypothetical protein
MTNPLHRWSSAASNESDYGLGHFAFNEFSCFLLKPFGRLFIPTRL